MELLRIGTRGYKLRASPAQAVGNEFVFYAIYNDYWGHPNHIKFFAYQHMKDVKSGNLTANKQLAKFDLSLNGY